MKQITFSVINRQQMYNNWKINIPIHDSLNYLIRKNNYNL